MSNWFQPFFMSHIHVLFAITLIILLLQLTLAKQQHCLIEWPAIIRLIGWVKIALTHVLHTIIVLGMDFFDD